MEVSIKGKTSSNSLVGIGYKIQVDVVSSERSTGQKQSKHKTGSKDTSKAAVHDETLVLIVGRIHNHNKV